ncbi:MAG: class I SAM-dependent methyltransferase [Rhizobiaceae bacterium]
MHIYDEQIAYHYSAYRPHLHELIVAEALEGRSFRNGLDVGCGTGYSSLALTNHCERVTGIDQSQSMLDLATEHPRVNYLLGSGEKLPIEDCSVDLVTFAGVFFYLNAEAALSELKRVCRENALVLPYDFEVLIEDLMLLFDLPINGGDDDYDHTSNPSGMAGVATLKQVSRAIDFQVSAEEAAHILLSDKSRHEPLSGMFGTSNPFGHVVERLAETGWDGRMWARIHYSIHQLEK